MAEQFLSIKTTGWESMEQDLDEAMIEMKKPIQKGLWTAGQIMAPILKQHIADDWYDAWGPPRKYMRRTDDPSQKGLYEQVEEAEVRGDSLLFEYLPSGEYKSKSGLNTQGANGDELINIIQYNRGWKYEPSQDRQGRQIMARPFWNNFVEAMKSGLLYGAFEEGFKSEGWSIIREGGDQDMAWAAGESIL